jgi:hypothetical protein
MGDDSLTDALNMFLPSIHAVRLIDLVVVAPALLNATGSSRLVLSIEALEEDDIAGVTRESGLDAAHGARLLTVASDSRTVAITAMGPARLSDNGVLAASSLANKSLHALDEVTGAFGSNVAVKEGVGVGCAVVGGNAELRVVHQGNESVDSDNLARVAGRTELTTGRAESSGDRTNTCGASVDELVANVDGVDNAEVGRDHANELAKIGLEIADLVDTSEELHAATLSRDGGGEIANRTTDIVGTDETNILRSEEGYIALDLRGGAAASIIGHQIVSNAILSSVIGPGVGVLTAVQVGVANRRRECRDGGRSQGENAEECCLHNDNVTW